MSFLEEINKRKEILKTTETVITHCDGTKYIHNKEMRTLGIEPIRKQESSKNYGFVVDLKPDNIPAEIILGLYVGSQDCLDEAILEKYKFTHILSIGVESYPINLDRKHIPCLDLPETSIENVLRDSCLYIEQALSNKGCVLVHCNAGVSRSATVVIGFLILQKNFLFQDAYDLVKSKRPSIQPNAGFMKQLRSLKSELK